MTLDQAEVNMEILMDVFYRFQWSFMSEANLRTADSQELIRYRLSSLIIVRRGMG
jgi:hypothetical protein